MLDRTNFAETILGGATFAGTVFVDVNVSPICMQQGVINFAGPCTVDYLSVARSLSAPGLETFLVATGMPRVVATYLIDSVRSLSESDLFQLLQSTVISYGGPDEAFAHMLHDALTAHGVRTWFFPKHATPGEPVHRAEAKAIREHDRMILICSEPSLQRPGVQREIEQALTREAREGGRSFLIPVLLDDYALEGWQPTTEPELTHAEVIRGRVCADFRDQSQFDAQLRRLIDALKRVRP